MKYFDNILNRMSVNENDFESLIVVLSILLDISEDIIRKIDLDSFKVILETISWITPLKAGDPTINFGKEITVGQFIDIENYLK